MKDKISKKLLICAVVSVLTFCVVSAGVLYSLFYRQPIGEEFTFPDFEGSPEDGIRSVDGMRIEKQYANSDVIPEGVVISQSPPPLSVIKIQKGQIPTLTLNISLGRESFVLDDLGGCELSEAKRYLREMLCEIKVVRIYGDFADELVSATYPEKNSRIFAGDRVILYVQTKKPVMSVSNSD